MKKIDLDKLQAAIRSQLAQARKSYNSDIANERGELFDAYMGEPYGDEVKGRSSVVMSDVMDTIEWIKPELLEIFTTGDKAVEFSPVGDEDVELAEQETAAVNHVFYRQNNGFLVFYEWFTDALLQKNGYVRSAWDERERVEIMELEDPEPDALAELQAEVEANGGDFDVMDRDVETVEEMQDFGDGVMMPVEREVVKSIRVRITHRDKRYVIETIAPEEMEISPRWKSVDLAGCPYAAHRAERPVSWLVEMGFDREQAKTISEANQDDDEEELKRFNQRGSTEFGHGEEADKSTREVIVREAYVRYDMDGDDKSELLRVWLGGSEGEILRWADGEEAVEEVDDFPFSSLTPIIVPHRHVGVSVAELVDDLQKIRTVLTRQMLDNVYLSNNATKVVYEDAIGEHTISDLISPQVGKIVRAAGAPGGVQYEVPPNLVPASLQALAFIDEVRENRSGVTKYNQGLDANSLNKTSSGITKILSQSQKKILLIARIFAETGVKDLFRRIHRDLRNGPSREMIVNMRGKYVPVDPSEWRERDDVTISVGLGTGDKDAQIQRLMALRQMQAEDAAYGLVGLEERARLNEKLVELVGFKGVGLFKSAEQAQEAAAQTPEQPDPTQQMLQMQMAIEQQKAQLEMAKLQLEATKAQMEDDRKRDETNVKAQVEIAKMQENADAALNMELIKRENRPG